MTWAIDHTLSENDEAQELGLAVIKELQKSTLITPAERDLAMVFSKRFVTEFTVEPFVGIIEDNALEQGRRGAEGVDG